MQKNENEAANQESNNGKKTLKEAMKWGVVSGAARAIADKVFTGIMGFLDELI